MNKHYKVEAQASKQAVEELVRSSDLRLEREMERVAASIAATEDLSLVGLTGPTCSGKTTAAKKLTEYFEDHGHRVHIISVDDFFYDISYLKRRADEDPDIEIDYDSEDTIDMALLEEKASSLLSFQPTPMPRFNFTTGMREAGETLLPQKGDIFLFEGIQVLYPKVDAILRGHSYRSIYICPMSSIEAGGEVFDSNEIRLMRRLVRDYRYRATEPAFTFYLWQSVRANEEKSIFPYISRCHEVIDSTLPYEVGMLKPYLQDILARMGREDRFYEQAETILKSVARVQTVPAELMTKNSLYKEFI